MATRPRRVPVAKTTESEMLALLRKRHDQGGANGASWAYFSHVRSAAGFDAKRTIDAIGMSLWPSRGLFLHGYEIKCSRSDWVKEMRTPEKAEEFRGLVDFFWLVVADKDIVQPGELPPGWGLLAKQGQRMVQITNAEATHDLTPEGGRRGHPPMPERFGRSFLAALLRSAVEQGASQADLRRAREDLIHGLRDEYEKSREALEQRAENSERLVRELERHAGIRIQRDEGTRWGYDFDVKTVGVALKATLAGEKDLQALEDRARQIKTVAVAVSREADEYLRRYGLTKEDT